MLVTKELLVAIDLSIFFHTMEINGYTLKIAGLKYGRTQRLCYCPEGWVKHLTQLLVENNPACVLSNIYPALGCI